jgi:hypothetical protein
MTSIGRPDARHTLIAVRRLCGHAATGPSGVAAQSKARQRPAIPSLLGNTPALASDAGGTRVACGGAGPGARANGSGMRARSRRGARTAKSAPGRRRTWRLWQRAHLSDDGLARRATSLSPHGSSEDAAGRSKRTASKAVRSRSETPVGRDDSTGRASHRETPAPRPRCRRMRPRWSAWPPTCATIALSHAPRPASTPPDRRNRPHRSTPPLRVRPARLRGASSLTACSTPAAGVRLTSRSRPP